MARRRNPALALLLTPRWIGITVLLFLACGVFALASSWQYHRATDQVDASRAAVEAAQPIGSLVPDDALQVPTPSLGRVAVAEGRYVADAWVTGRLSPRGEPGVWLISALDDGSGQVTAILRGWLPQKAETGSGGRAVSVTGRVSSPENFYASIVVSAPDELLAITQQRLAEVWKLPTRAGYLVLAEQAPALQPDDPQPVPPVFGNESDVGFPWQNAAYAVEWLIFIAFAGFMYWRLFRDDLHDLRAANEPVAQERVIA